MGNNGQSTMHMWKHTKRKRYSEARISPHDFTSSALCWCQALLFILQFPKILFFCAIWEDRLRHTLARFLDPDDLLGQRNGVWVINESSPFLIIFVILYSFSIHSGVILWIYSMDLFFFNPQPNRWCRCYFFLPFFFFTLWERMFNQ